MSRSGDASPPVSRRGFLQTAGAVGAQLALGDSALARMLPDVAAKENGRPSNGPADSQFAVEFDEGAIVSLRRVGDAFDTNYVRPQGRLGDVTIRYRRSGGEWRSFETAGADSKRRSSSSSDGASHESTYTVSDGERRALQVKIGFAVGSESIHWNLALENLSVFLEACVISHDQILLSRLLHASACLSRFLVTFVALL